MLRGVPGLGTILGIRVDRAPPVEETPTLKLSLGLLGPIFRGLLGPMGASSGLLGVDGVSCTEGLLRDTVFLSFFVGGGSCFRLLL